MTVLADRVVDVEVGLGNMKTPCPRTMHPQCSQRGAELVRGALEAVERMGKPRRDHLERLVVVVPTDPMAIAPWRGLRRCPRPKVPPLVGADQRRPLSMLPSSLNRRSRRRILWQTQDCPLEIDDFQKPGKTSQRYPPALPA